MVFAASVPKPAFTRVSRALEVALVLDLQFVSLLLSRYVVFLLLL